MITTNLGYPRIGPDRELKRLVEGHWRGKVSAEQLLAGAKELRLAGWRKQAEAGIDLVPSNDFSLYDQVLDHIAMFGAVPERYGWQGGDVDLATYFAMARGHQGVTAMEMTKWFNTNYHYISAELDGRFSLTENRPLTAWREAKDELGLETKPVIIGPLTFLALANNPNDLAFSGLLDSLLPLYGQVLAELAEAGVEWVQMDEPIAVMDLGDEHRELLTHCYRTLSQGSTPKLMVQTYFEDLGDNWSTVVDLPVAGIGLDLVRGADNLELLDRHGFPSDKALGIGAIDGRNVWRTDLRAALGTLERVGRHCDLSQAHLGPSCSLLHLPVHLGLEGAMDPSIREWMAYADERLAEIAALRRAHDEGASAVADALAESDQIAARRRQDPRLSNAAVAARLAALTEDDFQRDTEDQERLRRQNEKLGLPLFPTTTIGSFPQTAEVRQARAKYRSGKLDAAGYDQFLDEKFREVVALQEELGLDVLVHGEFERSDMVDFFAQQLDGVAFIEGWVQSYGTRCVRPPLIYGDVSRPEPMTVEVSSRVQKMTDRPLKGMLTGPVTILMWSFPRNDVSPDHIANQLGLAIRDEVRDLEAAGIPVIQIDEPAFREGLPLQRADRAAYEEWATRAFRLSSCGVRAETQIHTHMCYSEFNELMPAIYALGADVISIENSRSASELLEAFRDFNYDRGIGPGVYDVHSERVPSVEEMSDLLRRAAKVLSPQRLWVNPDCGLKTRGFSETEASLRNLVAAARAVRQELASG
ncbi:MAG: 5-methyltetrahydropteroyltriglutamate--homocysteine S-methyltransferase [Acidobacteriota bacterium]